MSRTPHTIFLLAASSVVVFALSYSAPQGEERHDAQAAEAPVSEVWTPDNHDGTYNNPVIYADYSDPDVIRVGDVFYLTSSSFSHFPGLPILESNDLINWRIIGHALPRYPVEDFNIPQHGNGVWAPAIRFHGGEYFIYFGDPDRGIFMTKAKRPEGPWSPLVLVRAAIGWIDPCPLWDDDGNAYLVHAWAKSRAGFNSVLTLNKMNPEGTRVLDDGVTIFDGRNDQPTIEGPKIYKRDGYYYIFAPAGGVKTGWQAVLRSRALYGPYETKTVLRQGTTQVNGPHQGAWVETATGESWFVHFQDRDAYGRIVLVEPMRWIAGWPVIGDDPDTDGVGEPVTRHCKPDVGKSYPVQVPATTDEFDSAMPGLQWQWESNPDSSWYSLEARKGWLRLYPQQLSRPEKNLWNAGNICEQKIPGPEFSCETLLDCSGLKDGEEAGMVVLGVDYSYIAVRRDGRDLRVVRVNCQGADRGGKEKEIVQSTLGMDRILLRLNLEGDAHCSFSFLADGMLFQRAGDAFVAKAGKWVGAKIGLFAVQRGTGHQIGCADFGWIRFFPEVRSK